MKKLFSSVALILAISIIFSITAFAEPGFAYGSDDLNAFRPAWPAIVADETVISLTPGSNESEMRFAWLSAESDKDPLFKIADNEAMADALNVEVKTQAASQSRNSNKVTVTGLEQGKTYYYSYTENGKWSEAEAFTVQPSDEFTVLYVSDAQIGRSGDEELEEVLVRDTCGWNYTVNKMMTAYPDAAFAISGGDQFQSPDSLIQMKAYLSPAALRSLPVANTIGNHDDDATLYGEIFNNPNEVTELFGNEAGTGYYYVYGDALFITINSNNTFMFDTAKILREATEAHPDTKWRVVTMHHSPYSATKGDGNFSDERLFFSSLYDLYDIDLCLSGHNHFYSRTAAMYAGEASEGEGTVYIQASSASGSNYDSLPESLPDFTETAFDERVPTYTAFTFTDDVITGTTYRTDTDEVIDSFEISDNTTNSDVNIFTAIISFFATLFSML